MYMYSITYNKLTILIIRLMKSSHIAYNLDCPCL